MFSYLFLVTSLLVQATLSSPARQNQNQVSRRSYFHPYWQCNLGSEYSASLRSCQKCSAGTFSPAGIACLPAPAGFYIPGKGATTFLPCRPGTFSTAGATTCTSCSGGLHTSLPASTKCIACAEGLSSIDKIYCITCPAGSYSTGGQTCVKALPGYFVSNSGANVQTPCADGSFSVSAGSTACQTCTGIGKPGFSSLATTFQDCVMCGAGTSLSSNFVSCIPCLPGYYSTTGICLPAPAGNYVSTSGASHYYPCDFGDYTIHTASTDCISCYTGLISKSSTSNTCQACPAGTTADAYRTACIACNDGYYSITGTCIIAPVGSYAARANFTVGASALTLCAAGSYSSKTGASACTLAAVGFYVSGVGAISQTACLSGSFTTSTGSIACKTCTSVGKLNQFSYQSTQDSCSLCPDGNGLDADLITCKSCLPGYYSSGGACLPAPAGNYVSTSGQSHYYPCDFGDYTIHTASTDCISCYTGLISKSSTSNTCQACPAGTTADAYRTACIACNDGYYSTTGTCIIAPVGSYSVGFNYSVGASTSTLCAAGSYSSKTGASACTLASVGFYVAVVGASSQIACTPGSFSTTTGRSSCQTCTSIGQLNQYAYSTTNAYCTHCSGGQGLNVDLMSCKDCSPGSYADGGVCVLAPAGFYVSSSGATIYGIRACDGGSFTLTTGTVKCSTCASTGSPGQISRSFTSKNCVDCPAGTHAEQFGEYCV